MKKLLLGLIGGAALGMLFAPEKGSKLRKKISESDDKLKDFGGEMISAGKELSSEVQKFLETDEAKNFFAKGKENLSDLLEKGKTEFSHLSEKGKEELKNAIERIKETIPSQQPEDTEKKEEKNTEKDNNILADLKNFFRK